MLAANIPGSVIVGIQWHLIAPNARTTGAAIGWVGWYHTLTPYRALCKDPHCTAPLMMWHEVCIYKTSTQACCNLLCKKDFNQEYKGSIFWCTYIIALSSSMVKKSSLYNHMITISQIKFSLWRTNSVIGSISADQNFTHVHIWAALGTSNNGRMTHVLIFP